MSAGTSRVFLATDEQAALQDTAGYPEFRWVFVPMDRSSLASSIKIEHRLHDESKTGLGAGKHAMFVGTLKELFLLGAADFYIGHLVRLPSVRADLATGNPSGRMDGNSISGHRGFQQNHPRHW